VPNRNTSYESNGPDVKLRGNAQQLNEKYLALAHDAAAAGERITAEAYTQFADHYFRLHQAAIDAAEERKAQHAAQAAERQPRAESQPQPEDAPQPETPAGDAAAEVVDLSPAKLSEMVQEEQDSASTG
tara:strand:+ start:2239 stop:2625 length:387 start_codon:yes stop_codon:yes gene_type:complete